MAITKKIEDIDKNSSLNPIVEKMLTGLSDDMNFPYGLIFKNQWLFKGLITQQLKKNDSTRALLETTITPTMLSGGIKENVLPQYIQLTFNARLLPGYTSEQLQNKIESILKKSKLNFQLTRLANVKEASRISSDESAFYRLLEQELLKQDIAVSPFLTLGMTDSHYLQSRSKDVYRLLPIVVNKNDLSRMHGVDERILVSNINLAINFYKKIMSEL